MKTFKKSATIRWSVLALFVLLTSSLFWVSCNEQDIEDLRHVKTVLGGCNKTSVSRGDDDLGMKPDVVTITNSGNKINVFVGLNYTCKCAPFTTQVEVTDKMVYMYIIDTCDPDDETCYERCSCYYTFDFTFECHNSKLQQPYKILLIDPRKENAIIVSEGIIEVGE